MDPPICDGLLGPSVSLWATGRPGGCFCPSPEPGLSKGRLHLWDTPTPFPSSSPQGFKISSPLSRGGVGNQAPHWALVPLEGQGTSEEPVYCPPPQPAACASLGTKQSLLSNFKCYLRTAWPQPKTALWKLAFRCRGCKYQRHTFGEGGASMPLPPQWQGLALNGHTDTQIHRSPLQQRDTHYAVACTPGARQLCTTAHTLTHTTHTY